MTSYDYLQTSDVLPASGNYTVYFTYDTSNLTKLGYSFSGPNSIPSGSIVRFDNIQFYCDGYKETISINGFTYNLNATSTYNPMTQRYSFGDYTGFIVSYDGKYNVWGISNDYISKLVTTVPMNRVSQGGTPPVYQPLIQTNFGATTVPNVGYDNITFTCGTYPIPSGVGISLIGVSRLGTVASGISDADIAGMNASQVAISPLLNDSAAEPSGFVRYRAYAGNYIYDPNYAPFVDVSSSDTGQSYLPSNNVVSGATYSTYEDNIGTFTYLPASSIPMPVTPNSFASGYMNPHTSVMDELGVPTLGSGRVYDVNNDNVLYSGWIDYIIWRFLGHFG